MSSIILCWLRGATFFSTAYCRASVRERNEQISKLIRNQQHMESQLQQIDMVIKLFALALQLWVRMSSSSLRQVLEFS